MPNFSNLLDKGKSLPIVKKFTNPAPFIPVIRLNGVIGAASRMRSGLSFEGVAPLIEKAFSYKDAKAVALVINSPGGSPTQSGLIFKRIRDLATEKEKKVYAFTEDVAASGGYLLALAADEIYAHDASIIGSIGVISGGFGFPEAMKKIGVERRIYTAGESKSMLDPFSPEKEEDVERLKALQAEIHEYFKSLVRDRRGDKLKEARKKLFSGDVWVGKQAVRAGLVDGVGDLRGVLREAYGDEVKLRLIEAPKRLFFRSGGLLSQAVEALPESTLATLEQRSHWARFGL